MGKRILIVDDAPQNLRVAGAFLKNAGYQIVLITSGEVALQKIPEIMPDLILLDIMMPEMDGLEVCQALKASSEPVANIPVIFMTALDREEDKVRGFRAGGVDYVTKPIYSDELLARVQTHIRLAELTNNLRATVHEQGVSLAEAYKKLAALDQAKSRFLAVASHELRTPITILSGYAQVAADAGQKYPELAGMMNGVVSGAKRLTEIVNAMLDVARIDSEVLEVFPESLDLSTLIGEVAAGYEEALRERRLVLEIHTEPLPAIEADGELLQKAIGNLLNNAIKYTPDGGRIAITACATRDETLGDWVEIQVQDRGIGIAADQLTLIFEKFHQVGKPSLHSSGRTKFKGGGPGLGLPIVRGVVQAHGGQVWAESPGHDEMACPGSTFHILLPFKQTAAKRP
ncbi:MAG: hybrid sensor histidine kinase/response regulator [Chloroflexota bacterium]